MNKTEWMILIAIMLQNLMILQMLYKMRKDQLMMSILLNCKKISEELKKYAATNDQD